MSGTDAGAQVEFSGSGIGSMSHDFPSCAAAFTAACGEDVYAAVQTQIDLSTSLFKQSAQQGGYLTLAEVNSALGQISTSAPAAEALVWIEFLLYPDTPANNSALEKQLEVFAMPRAEVALARNSLSAVLNMQARDAGTSDAGASLLALEQTNGWNNARAAANSLATPDSLSPIDSQFTPNYTVVDMARALGVWGLWLSYWGVTDSTKLPSNGLNYFADQVSHYAAATRARAAARCAEKPVSPACATVASYEAQRLAPALDRLAAQMLAAADAGVSP